MIHYAERTGREKGEKIGEESKLVNQIKKKLDKGKMLSQIADELEETEETIQRIIEKYDMN